MKFKPNSIHIYRNYQRTSYSEPRDIPILIYHIGSDAFIRFITIDRNIDYFTPKSRIALSISPSLGTASDVEELRSQFPEFLI